MTKKFTSDKTTLDSISLKRNFSWVFLGNAIYVASQGGILIILSKLGNPEMVGQFALALAFCSPIFLFANLKLRDILATDIQQRYTFYYYTCLRLITTVCAFFCVVGFVMISGYQRGTSDVILLMSIVKVFESWSDIIYGLLQQQERMERIAKSMILKGLISLPLFGIIIFFSKNIVYGVTTIAFVWALLLITYDFNSEPTIRKTLLRILHNFIELIIRSKMSKFFFVTKILLKLSWVSLPLGLVAIFTSLSTNTPKYLIAYFWGEYHLGIYTALAYSLVAGHTLVNALAQASLPKLSYYYKTGNRFAFQTLLFKAIGIGTLIIFLGLAIVQTNGYQLLTILYGSEYAKHVNVLIWLVIASGFNYIGWFLNSGLTAMGWLQVQTLLQGVTIIIVFIAAFFLIPLYGLRGAAWATCIGFIIKIPLLAIVYYKS